MMNRLHGLWSLGSVLGGLAAATLAESAVSLSTHLTIAAIILAALSMIVATQLLPVDEVHADETAPTVPADADVAASATNPHRRRSLKAFFVAGLAAVAIETAAISWAAFRITDDLAGSAAVAALAYVAVVGGMTITRFAGDHLAHHWGADRLMAGSAILAIACLIIAGTAPTQLVTLAAFLAAGLGIATLTPRLYDLAARAGNGTASGLGVLTGGGCARDHPRPDHHRHSRIRHHRRRAGSRSRQPSPASDSSPPSAPPGPRQITAPHAPPSAFEDNHATAPGRMHTRLGDGGERPTDPRSRAGAPRRSVRRVSSNDRDNAELARPRPADRCIAPTPVGLGPWSAGPRSVR